jgi:hypothetical protein
VDESCTNGDDAENNHPVMIANSAASIEMHQKTNSRNRNKSIAEFSNKHHGCAPRIKGKSP